MTVLGKPGNCAGEQFKRFLKTARGKETLHILYKKCRKSITSTMLYKEQNKSMVIKDINIKVPKVTMN